MFEHHRAINPLHHQVAVCPDCSYAGFLDDYNRLFAAEKDPDRKGLEPFA